MRLAALFEKATPLFLATVLVAGCGGGDGLTTTPADLFVPDMSLPPDLIVVKDLYMPPTPPDLIYVPADADGITCGSMTCNNGQTCCYSNAGGGKFNAACIDGTSCGDGGLDVQCDGPEDCSGNPCCAQVDKTQKIMGVMCAGAPTDCKSMINFQTQSGQTRLCHQDQDCTAGDPNAQFPTCCTAMYQGQAQHICFSKPYLAFTQGRVTCP